MTNEKWIDCDEFPIDEAITRLKRLDNIVNNFYSESLYMAIKALEAQPRPTGKWIDIGNEGLVFKCSLCGLKKTIESHYCPNCGARMAESEDKE